MMSVANTNLQKRSFISRLLLNHELNVVGQKVHKNKSSSLCDCLNNALNRLVSVGTSHNEIKTPLTLVTGDSLEIVQSKDLSKIFKESINMTAETLQSINIKDSIEYKTGRKKVVVAGQQYTMHPITITVNDYEKEAVILKKTGHGGR